MEKKLYRNEHDKMIAGVASGLADYLQVDVTIIRLVFAISVPFLAGAGLIAYLIIWVIVPTNDDPLARFSKFNEYFRNNNPDGAPFNAGQGNPNWSNPMNDQNMKTPFETQPNLKVKRPNDTGRTVLGLLLLVIGCFLLMRQLDIIPDWFRLRNFWPVIFIVLGVSIIAKSRRKKDWEQWHNQNNPMHQNTNPIDDAVVVDQTTFVEKDSDTNPPQA